MPEEVRPPQAADPEAIETATERRKRFREGLIVRQKGHHARLMPMLLELRKYFRSLDAAARRKHLQGIDMMLRYYDGDMYGGYNELGIYEDDRQEGDFAYAIPVLAGHVGEAFMQLLKVNPDYVVTANNARDDNTNRLARMCEELGVENLTRLMQEDELQTEAITAILTGDSYREIFWSVNPRAPRKVKRIRQTRVEFEIPGRRECLNCRMEVVEGVTECPACGVASIRDIPPGQGVRFDPEEYEEEVGENRLRIPHPMGIQCDLSALRFEDSTHLIEHDYLERQKAAWLYQSPIKHGESGLSAEMQARHNLERSTPQMDAIVGSSREAARAMTGRKVERERYFLEVSEYGWIYCDVEEMLPNPVPDPLNPGKMTDRIPAGTLLGDFFREGVYLVFLGETVMELQPMKKHRRWVKVQYGKRPGSSTGTGSRLIAMLNDIVNDDYNLVHAVKHTSAHPFRVVAGQSVKLLPSAGNFLRIDRLPSGVSDIRAAIAQYPGMSVAGMDATSAQIQQAMQFIFGSYTLGAGGAPDMSNFGGTATEVTARIEQASGRQIGPIGQRIRADKETIMICLENIQEYSTEEQRAELAKRFGPDTAALFFKTNLRQHLTIGIKPNSDLPRSLAMSQAGRLAFMQAAAELVPVAEQAPWVMEFLEGLADTYSIPLSMGRGRSDRRKAEERLNKLAAIEEELQEKSPEMFSDPHQAAQFMYAALSKLCWPLIAPAESEQDPAQADPLADVPRIFIQDHDTFMDAYKDELLSERAMTYSPARILTIIKLWEDHFFANLMRQAEMAKVQQALGALAAPPEQPAPDPQAAMAAEGEQEIMRGALEHEAGQAAADNEMRRQMALREHEQQLKEQSSDAELERRVAEQAHQAQIQAALEQSRPAPE